MNSHRARLLFIALALAACSSQSQPAATASAGSCKVDVRKICDDARTGEIRIGVERADARSVEHNAPITMDIEVPITLPNGEVAAEASCAINSIKRTVIYARLGKAPQSEAAAVYLRSVGLCE